MGKFMDLTGQRFGRLVVIERANKPGEDKSPTWLCRCDCGNAKVIRGQSLRESVTVSCGCWQRENAESNMTRTHKDAKLGLVAGTNISRIKNPTMYRNNTTGHAGVYARRIANGQIKYRATYQLQGKPHFLGTFDTIEEAARVRDRAVEEAHSPILEAYKKGTMERRCAECGNLFMPANARQITCSTACAKARHNAQAASYQRSKYIRNKKEGKARTVPEEPTTERIPYVYFKKGRWVATPNQQYIGSFATQEEAAAAVEKYKADHAEFRPRNCYGYKRYEGQETPRDQNMDKPKLPYVHYKGRRWVVEIKHQRLGAFETQEEAVASVERYKAEHPEFQARKVSNRSRYEQAEGVPKSVGDEHPIPYVYQRGKKWAAVINRQEIGCYETKAEASEAVDQYIAQHPDFKPIKRYYERREKPKQKRDPNRDKPSIPYVHYAHGRWKAIPNSKYQGTYDTQEEAAAAVESYKAEHPEFKPRAIKRWLLSKEGGKENE